MCQAQVGGGIIGSCELPFVESGRIICKSIDAAIIYDHRDTYIHT